LLKIMDKKISAAAFVGLTLAAVAIGARGSTVHAQEPGPQVAAAKAAAPAKDVAAPEMPADVLKAWEGAGFKIAGWVSTEHGDLVFRAEGSGKQGHWPVFSPPGQFDRRFPWYAKSLPTLPPPPVGFGLSLQATANDEVLKGLARMKELRWLNITGRRWTAAGLKGLAPLQKLQVLDSDGSDACLKELKALKQLTHLMVHCDVVDPGVPQRNLFTVTDVGLKELGALRHLRSLTLAHATVTEAGLKELAPLTELRTLDLDGVQVKAAGLKELAALKQLETLSLTRTNVADADLEGLAPLKGLKSLKLSSNYEITGAGLKKLSALPQLQTLDLSSTSIKNIDELSSLPQLRMLNLSSVPLEKIQALAACKRLQAVELGPNVPEAEVARLQKAAPHLKIKLHRLPLPPGGRSAAE
jgi:hypothetical protein